MEPMEPVQAQGREEDALVTAFVADAADGGVGGVHGCGCGSACIMACGSPTPVNGRSSWLG